MSLMCHEAGRLCLLQLDDILGALEIPYFLMQGTALGAYRDNGFVPTERDIDLGVLYEDLKPKALGLLLTLMNRDFDVEAFTIPFTRPRTVVAFKEYGGKVVKADIVGMVRWKDVRFTATPVRSYVEEPYALVHPAAELESYRPHKLFGRTFRLPFHIEKYLEAEYGPEWRTPADDHVSRTRVYDFLSKEQVPNDYLER